MHFARTIAEEYGLIKDDWNGFNVLHTAAARVAGMDMGFLPSIGGLDIEGILSGASAGTIDIVYLLGADEIDMSRLGDAFVIYQGHHGDAGANRADVILPGAAFTEKNGTYVNTEGRVQLAKQATQPPGDAKEDWKIIRALSDLLGAGLDFTTLGDVRARLVEENSLFDHVGDILSSSWDDFGSYGEILGQEFECPISNYYMTCSISRASQTMAECSKELFSQSKEENAADA